MYKHIHVPVDNSEHSNRAIDLAVELGRAFGARLTGSHVYAARLHDYRFKQMEYTLPEEYKDENELERQRKIHDSLIAMGLQLISESYLDVKAKKATDAGLTCERKMIDGKHYKVLIDDTKASDYDLVVMGALGMGAVKDSQLGSVTERYVRHVDRDTLVVRSPDALKDAQGAIVVCVDGSPQTTAWSSASRCSTASASRKSSRSRARSSRGSSSWAASACTPRRTRRTSAPTPRTSSAWRRATCSSPAAGSIRRWT